jgi:hypothetical protein
MRTVLPDVNRAKLLEVMTEFDRWHRGRSEWARWECGPASLLPGDEVRSGWDRRMANEEHLAILRQGDRGVERVA